MSTLNIGILAHVDAGKTSLTERLLYDGGAIARLGHVDAGDTQTDTGTVERRRGITVRSAVASFTTGSLRVNLIDTPGHADFISEVERALTVLDGAVLLLSAVEGVQAQTRVLMRTLRRMGLPMLLFVNKIDRAGARGDDLLAEIRRRLTPRIVALNAVRDIGTPDASTEPVPPDAEVLAERDDALLETLVSDRVPAPGALAEALAAQTADGLVHPVCFGSALGGQGVADLVNGIGTLLRVPDASPADPVRGTIFAVERDRAGHKIAYLRLYAGEVRARQRLDFGERTEQVSALGVVGTGAGRLAGGEIAKVWGLTRARVGDRVGPAGETTHPHFAPPSLEAVVRAATPDQTLRLHAALVALADQDPLIRTRALPGGATSVLLYGEVQKEVLTERLAGEFGVEAVFEESRLVYLERPLGVGECVFEMGRPFAATVGLRVEPGTGFTFRREVEVGSLPHAFNRAIEETVRTALGQGLHGWPVTDCAVTLTRTGYASPVSTSADFRGVTPMVLLPALARAGTRVYEPCRSFELELAPEAFGAVTAMLAALGADVADCPSPGLIRGHLPARSVREVERRLPGLTHGEAAWWSRPSGDRPVVGRPPQRPRTDGNPLDRQEYLRYLAR